MTTQPSALMHDLNDDSHDVLYCAASYLARRGGPAIEGSPDDVANLRAGRASRLDWLGKQPNADEIGRDYLQFKMRWSPVYRD